MEGNVAEAAGRKQWDKVKDLVDRGGDVNIRDGEGWTALHRAAYHTNVEMCKFLLGRGADVAAGDKNGDMAISTAISMPCGSNCLDVVRLLLTDVTVNAVNNYGRRPLHYAALRRLVDIVQLLVDHGAHTNVVDEDGATPLHDANRWGDDVPAVTEILLCKEAKVDAVNKDGNQPLHVACMYGHIKSARLLLSSGASSHASNNNGETPLHCAAGAMTHVSELCNILLTHDADVHAADKYRNQPLHVACRHNNIKIGKVLISHGADVVAINGQNLSPFQLASRHCEDHPDLCLALYRAGLTSIQTEHICQALEFAFSKNNQLTGWVLSKIYTQTETSLTEKLSEWIDTIDIDELLVTALDQKQIESCLILIENGASVNGPDLCPV